MFNVFFNSFEKIELILFKPESQMRFVKKILKRYEKDDYRYVIKISTDYFRDLFNKFDRTSSFIKRDLDYDLADYLFDSASDLEGREFYIKINLHSENKSEELENKVNQGIDSYFDFELQKTQKRKRTVIKKIFVHIILAVICFFISYISNKIINIDTFLYVLFVRSIVIAAWVLMWPVFSDFIYELLEIIKIIKIYKKLIDAEIKFTYLKK
jgi:hypothetical protein